MVFSDPTSKGLGRCSPNSEMRLHQTTSCYVVSGLQAYDTPGRARQRRVRQGGLVRRWCGNASSPEGRVRYRA